MRIRAAVSLNFSVFNLLPDLLGTMVNMCAFLVIREHSIVEVLLVVAETDGLGTLSR